MKEAITIEQLLYIFPILLSAFFTLVVLTQKKSGKTSRIVLAVFFGEFFIVFLTALIVKLNFVVVGQIFISLLLPALLALAPTGYIYFKSLTTENYSFSKKDFLHFIPSLFALLLHTIITIILVFSIVEVKSNTWEILQLVLGGLYILSLFFGTIIQMIIYNVASVKLYKLHQRRIKNYFSEIESIKLKWMKYFLIAYDIYLFTSIITDLFSSQSNSGGNIIYLCISTLFILFTGYFAIKQADIYPLSEKSDILDNKNNQDISNLTSEPENENINTTSNAIDEKETEGFYADVNRQLNLKNEIIKCIEDNKLYLDNNLKLENIANMLRINKKYLSFVINNQLKTNFFSLINDYRINEAIQHLSDSQNDNYTIEAIGNNCGFKNRTTFLNAFKKQTGKTPSEFKQEIKIKSNI